MTTSSNTKKIKNISGRYSPEIIEKYGERIADIEARQDLCLNCKGNCKQEAPGFSPAIEIVGGVLYERLAICEHEKKRRQQVKIKRLLQSSGVPRAYAGDTFADYTLTVENAKAIKAAKWLTENGGGRGLYLYGERGTGKTKLAAIVANEIAKKGNPVIFSSVPDLMSDIRATFSKGTTDEAVRQVKETPFLVLDDLGAENPSPWVGEQLFAIINYRYNAKLPTLVTSNYDNKEVVQHLAERDRKTQEIIDDTQGQRIMSRICEMCVVMKLSGKDWRTRGRERRANEAV